LQGITNKNLILQVVEDSDKPLTPKQIYNIINKKVSIKRVTVRGYLRQLYKSQKILQPYPEYYCNRLIYSVIRGPLVVHNIHYSIAAPFLRRLDKFEDVTEFTGGVKLFVQFGKQRRNISGFISNDVPGMSKDALLFALNRVIDIVERDTGKVVFEGFTLTSFETNKDYPGKRLDGKISCLTKTQLFDVIERVYQKDDDTIRCEKKISSDLKVDEAVALLRNELPDVNVSQGLFVLKERVEGLTVSQKFGNRELVEVNDKVKRLEGSITKLVDVLNGKNGKAPVSGSVGDPVGQSYIS